MRFKEFDANIETKNIIDWIKNYFADFGKDKKAIIGMSGGKDSSIAAALCVEALGADNVIGVIMPNGEMTPEDYQCAIEACSYLDIRYEIVNIGDAVNALYGAVSIDDCTNYYGVVTNTPARIRMTTLYMLAMMFDGLVVNTCNASEDYIGFSTKYGDAAGDFSPLGNYTATEVIAIGDALGMPYVLVHKQPSDGMCGRTDEENFGFTYAELDDYIRNDIIPKSVDTLSSIKWRHKISRHKYKPMPTCIPAMNKLDYEF